MAIVHHRDSRNLGWGPIPQARHTGPIGRGGGGGAEKKQDGRIWERSHSHCPKNHASCFPLCRRGGGGADARHLGKKRWPKAKGSC